MPAYAAIAMGDGSYIFCGGQPQFEDDTKIAKPAKVRAVKSAPKKANSDTVDTFASLSRERSLRFFENVSYVEPRMRDSHGRHGRKKIKARQLSH